MDNNYSNIVDNSRLPEQNIYSCRFCYKQFIDYREYTVHERMHFEQMSLRGMFDNNAPPFNTSPATGTLDSFDKLIQPFRSSAADTPIRPTDTRILAPSSQPFRSSAADTPIRPMDVRILAPSSQSDFRNYVPSSSADPRNIVSSPVDPRIMVANSPSDPRNIMPSSPAEQRNIITKSPADPRNLIPSSPADSRNLAVSSPADHRNVLPTSPADPRNMVPASPVDPRNMVPASPVDPRNMVPASPVDPRNIVPVSPVDPRNMVPASPVDPRNMVPASPVDPRNMVPASPVDPRNMIPGSPATQQDPRNLLVSSPASQSDKVQQMYRKDLDGQNVNLIPRVTNPQSPSMSMANVSMSADVISVSVDNRTPQVPDARRQPSLSVPLYLDALSRRSSENISNHPMSSSSFSTHAVGRPEDMLGIDNRQHNIQKPDAYYGIPKSHYHSSSGLDVGDGYSGNQYDIGKLLSPPSQYYQQNIPAQSQATPYGIDKLTTTPLNYYNHPPSMNDKSNVEQRDLIPTQTLHYGPSVQTVPVSNHSLYQSSIPHTNLQMNNSQVQKAPNSMDQSRPFRSGSDSPHSTYSQLYKGSHPQAQVFAPVPSHALPSQHDYKLSMEPVPSINLETRQNIRCTICQAPFLSVPELQVHLKTHVPEMIAQSKTSLTMVGHKPPMQNYTPASESAHMSVTQSSEMRPVSDVEQANVAGMNKLNPLKAASTEAMPFKCDCGKMFSKHAQYVEHAKTHSVSQQYECKICKKVFKKKSKCARHEALHSRDIHLYYCEFCDLNFEQKGKYLQHIQRQHTQQDLVRSHQHREHQAGTKKAVPLTGGSIDTSFEAGDHEKFIDCQICDEEICRVDLFIHLKRHDVHACDKCDQVFLQKTECVAHLMSQHRQELDDSRNETLGGRQSEQHKLDKDGRKVLNKTGGESNFSGNENKKVNKSRKEVIKDLKEKKKEVMKNLKEKQKEILDLKKQKSEKILKTHSKSPDGNASDKNVELNKNRPQMAVGEMKLKFGCSKCEKSFAKKSDLTTHVETHVKDPNKIYCEVCDCSYHLKEKGYYIYHMKYHRDHELLKLETPPQLPCIICNTKINKDNFVTHVKRTHSQYSCDICQWSYSSESSLVKHMRTIHVGKKYKNYVYDKSHYIENIVEPAPVQEQPVVYKKLKDIKAEQKIGEQSPAMVFPCQECNRTFTKKQYYERHLKTHSNSNDDGQISCEVCKQGFESRGTYIYHLQHHTKDMKVHGGKPLSDLGQRICKKEFEEGKMDVDQQDEKTMGNSVKEKTPVIKQTVITVLNPETGDFEEQLIEEKDEPEIVFDIKLFEDPPNDDESADVADDSGVSDVVSEIVYCKLCNKSLKRNGLPEHMQSHQTFNCDVCQYSFTKKARYLDHCRILHLSDYIEKEVEQFEEAEKAQIEDVSQNAHSEEQKEKDLHRRKKSTKVVNCSLCTTELKLDKFVEHMRTHLKPEFSCKFCERTFSRKTNLQMHEKSHELISFGKIELPYPKSCPYCEIPMQSRENYLSHWVEHSKKVPMKCTVCENAFMSEKNLENHVKTLHDQNIRVYWTRDGEGMKFDCKTGRIFEVYSDYLCEIKEINDLFQQFGMPAIWMTATPRKVKDKSSTPVGKNKINLKTNAKASESVESSESEEKVKSETSDEDYVPERTLRKRKNAKSSSESDAVDDDDDFETEEESDAGESRPVRKRRRSQRCTSEDSEHAENYKPKGTRTRKFVKKPELKLRQTVKKLKSIQGRVLRSTLDSKSTKLQEKRENLKRIPEEENRSSSDSPKKRRSEIDNLSFEEVVKVRESEDYPEKCPVCGIAQFSLSSYELHSKIHTDDSPFRCPVCKQTFTRKCNMLIHIKHRHKGYKFKGLRRTDITKPVVTAKTNPIRSRGRPCRTETKSNPNLFTPMKGTKLVVRLSPIDIEEKMRAVRENAAGAMTSDHKFLQSIEKKSHYSCEYCKKTFNQRWNYAQHIQGHKRVTKKKEKDTKSTAYKKELKKKEKESKPFSCKDCSESFKKKRDLYIHTKIHFADPADEDDNTLNVSTTSEVSVQGDTGEKVASEVENVTDSLIESYTDVNNSSITESENNASSLSDVNEKLEESVDKKISEKLEIVNEITKLASEQNTSSAKVSNSCDQNSKTSDESLIENMKNNGCDTAPELLVAQNNNEDHNKVTDNEEDKSKLQRTPSINKLSAETAVIKWKARVTELLSSQLELNATKKQQELANPDVRKVKDYLSISGKGQKLRYECRICGDISDQEEVFRSHMDVHLNEHPPHCNKCDIYFMAIYPRRRLLEHNRKKHPELSS